MSFSAPILGGLQSYRKLRWQDDFLSDILKVELVIVIGTAICAFLFWTVLNLKKENLCRGIAAGFMTALVIMPLPVFAAGFKKKIILNYNDQATGLVSDIFYSITYAFGNALPIYASKAIIAIPLSMAVGYGITKLGADET